MIRNLSAGIILGLAVSGCSILAPYDQKFMCEATDDYGRCIGVEQAYNEAIGGRVDPSATTAMGPGLQEADGTTGYQPAGSPQMELSAARQAYKAAEYREMQKLIEQPVTPMVKPPKVLRTLIVAYPDGTTTLYSPRFIWYFAHDGRFVIGDYLNQAEDAESGALTPFSGSDR
jgi:conjugal transfer pilus assembly protein TraV